MGIEPTIPVKPGLSLRRVVLLDKKVPLGDDYFNLLGGGLNNIIFFIRTPFLRANLVLGFFNEARWAQ